MIKIIGYYAKSANKCESPIISSLKNVFESRTRGEDFLSFQEGPVFLDYHKMQTEESGDFFFIDKKNQTACFIVGNIYSFEKNGKTILFKNANKARLVLDLRKKDPQRFPSRLRGEFNIVIFEKNKLFLINDSLGLSPMYIYPKKDGVFFCNSPECLIRGTQDHVMDYASIAEFLSYGFIPSGNTFIRDLCNQRGGSILCICGNVITSKSHFKFKKLNFSRLAREKKLQLINNAFTDAVKIRCPGEKCPATLTGGWDTRFILAHLLSLNKKVIAVTCDVKKEDAIISSRISKAFSLEHFHSSATPPSQKKSLMFKLPGKESDQEKIPQRLSHFDKKEAMPRFYGYFGTELFGHVPTNFMKKILENFGRPFTALFTDTFLNQFNKKSQRLFLDDLRKIGHFDNLIYTFLTQVGRAYLSTLYPRGWERPTRIFSYKTLVPFADSQFAKHLWSLNYPDDFRYKTYLAIYQKFFPEFLKFPWTHGRFRPSHGLGKKSPPKKKNVSLRRYINLLKSNRRFKNFVGKNKIILKNKSAIRSCLKELYFVFEWLEAHKNVVKYDKEIF